MIDLLDYLFPSIDPYTHYKAREVVGEFLRDRKYIEYTLPNTLPFLAQGDVVSELSFTFYNEEGQRKEIKKCKGMLMSNTCDAENDEIITFCPLLPLEACLKEDFDRDNLINNNHYSLFYIPNEPKLENYIIDMSMWTSYTREYIMWCLENGEMTKECSLSLKGYYFFLLKLTVHFMRPEASEAIERRSA